MAHTNYQDMLRDHETHQRRLEGETGLFSGLDSDHTEEDKMVGLLEAAIAAEQAIIDALNELIADQREPQQ